MRQRFRGFLLRLALFACGFLIATQCRNGMYRDLNYQYDPDMSMTWRTFLYDGLNDESTGACSGDGLVVVRAYAGYPRHVRDQVEQQYIKDRVAAKGFGGMMDFWLRKQVMGFNDGTFSWFQEGFFNAWPYSEITDSSWKEPLREFYWEDGANYMWFKTISQGVWLFVLLGIVVQAILALIRSFFGLRGRTSSSESDSLEMRMDTIFMAVFIGVFLFIMLFEGRARYLFNSSPLFSTMALLGYFRLADCLARLRTRLGTVG